MISAQLESIFNKMSDAVMCIKDDTAVYMNSSAVSLLSKDMTGCGVSEIFGDIPADSFENMCSFTAEISSGSVYVLVSPIDDMFLLTVKAAPNDDFAAHLCSQIGGTINNSLAVVFAALGCIRSNIESSANEQVKNYLAMVTHSSYQIQHIVSNIQRLEDLSENQVPCSGSTFDLALMCSDIVSTSSLLTHETCAPINFSTTLPDAFIEGNSIEVEEAVFNLISNALRFTPKDGSIDITLTKKHQKYILTISDTGPGIPDHIMPHLFSGYRSTREFSETSRGLGFGLAITYRIVRRHGGTVCVMNRPGGGTSVSVSFPQSNAIQHFNSPRIRYESGGMGTVLSVLADILKSDCYHGKYLD